MLSCSILTAAESVGKKFSLFKSGAPFSFLPVKKLRFVSLSKCKTEKTIKDKCFTPTLLRSAATGGSRRGSCFVSHTWGNVHTTSCVGSVHNNLLDFGWG